MKRKILKKFIGKFINISIDSSPIRGHQILIYIEFSKNKIKKTLKPHDKVFIDLDSKNKLVGVEII